MLSEHTFAKFGLFDSYVLRSKLPLSTLPLAIDLPGWFGDESRECEPVVVFVLLQIGKCYEDEL